MQQPGNLGGLAPRRGAQVQHPVAGLRVQGRNGGGGGGLLSVEHTGMVGGQTAKALVPLGVKGGGGKGGGLYGKGNALAEEPGRALQRVDPHPTKGGLGTGLQKGGVLGAQQGLHSGEKRLGQGHRRLLSEKRV